MAMDYFSFSSAMVPFLLSQPMLYVHWTDLKKRVLGSCHPFATDATFASQMQYLLSIGLVERKSRGIYRITEKGIQYLRIMS